MKITDLKSQFRQCLLDGWPFSEISRFLGVPVPTLEQWYFEDPDIEPIDDPILKSLAWLIRDISDELHRRGMFEVNGRWIPILVACEPPDHFHN